MKVIAVDISGSVSGSIRYWSVVREVYDKHEDLTEPITIVLWDTKATIVELPALKKFWETKRGCGGTKPYCFLQLLPEDITTLVLLTDGQVNQTDIDVIDQNNLRITNVECHIIDNNPNLSVTCPFTRNNNAVVYTHTLLETKLVLQINAKDYALLDQIDSLSYDNFLENYDRIHTLLVASTMGKVGNQSYKDMLVRAKNKMTQEIISRSYKPELDTLDNSLTTGDGESAIDDAQSLINEYYNGNNDINIFASKIDRLINLANGMKGVFGIQEFDSGFNTHSYNTASTIAAVDEEALDDLEVEDVTAYPMECPITFMTDVPVIMVVEGEAIFRNIDKNLLQVLLKTPLAILSYPDIINKIKSRLGHSVGLEAYKELQTDPFTRKTVVAAIPLGAHPEHIRLANHTLALLFSNGKILCNLDLLFAVIWKIIDNDTNYYLYDLSKTVTDQMIYRLNHSKTTASLSGLPQFVLTKVTLGSALWFVLASGMLSFPSEEFRPLRTQIFQYETILSLLQLVQYPVSKIIQRVCTYTYYMLKFLTWCKKETQFPLHLRALYQSSWKLSDGTIVFKDGGGYHNEYFRNVPLTTQEILYLGSLVSPSASSSDISIPNRDEALDAAIRAVEEKCIPVNNWWIYEGDDDLVEVCELTCRPWSTVRNNGCSSTWKDQFATRLLKVQPEECVFHGDSTVTVNGQRLRFLSVKKHFGDFVVIKKAYPTLEEFAYYLYQKEVNSGKASPTLPVDIEINYRTLLKEMDTLINKLSPLEFGKRFTASVSFETRAKIERQFTDI